MSPVPGERRYEVTTPAGRETPSDPERGRLMRPGTRFLGTGGHFAAVQGPRMKAASPRKALVAALLAVSTSACERVATMGAPRPAEPPAEPPITTEILCFSASSCTPTNLRVVLAAAVADGAARREALRLWVVEGPGSVRTLGKSRAYEATARGGARLQVTRLAAHIDREVEDLVARTSSAVDAPKRVTQEIADGIAQVALSGGRAPSAHLIVITDLMERSRTFGWFCSRRSVSAFPSAVGREVLPRGSLAGLHVTFAYTASSSSPARCRISAAHRRAITRAWQVALSHAGSPSVEFFPTAPPRGAQTTDHQEEK